MARIELRPIKISTKEFDEIEKRIKKAFRRLLYLPLIKELGLPLKLKNAVEDLISAINEGKITYSRGSFRGSFSAKTSKELRNLGAIWDKKTSAFKIPITKLPYEIRSTISASATQFEDKMRRVDDKLKDMSPELFADSIKTSDLFDRTLWKAEADFQKTLHNITITPTLTDEQRARIADEYQNNMDLWITKYTEEQIVELRKAVQQAVFAGNRWESIVKSIKESSGRTDRKARFLARQETQLLMTKFKEVRYADAGVEKYKWGCVKLPHDKPPPAAPVPGNVRYSHGILEGKIFRFDNPPVTSNPNQKTRRNNPGADYNCRCFSIPIVEF